MTMILNPYVFASGGDDPFIGDVILLNHGDDQVSSGPNTFGSAIGLDFEFINGGAEPSVTLDAGSPNGTGYIGAGSQWGNVYTVSDIGSDGNFGTDDLTIEGRVKITGVTTDGANLLTGMSVIGTFDSELAIAVNKNTGVAQVHRSGVLSGSLLSGSTDLRDSQWHTISYSRVSGTGYLHVDGVLENSQVDGNNYNYSGGGGKAFIGAYNNGTVTAAWQLFGQIQEVRWTKGAGRYNGANYTPENRFPDS